MALEEKEIESGSAEERHNLASEALDGTDENMLQQELPAWKKELIRQRIENDKASYSSDVIVWATLREKYKQ